MSKLYRIGDAAKILGVSVQTLRRWDEEGKLKPVRIGKERRYKDEEKEDKEFCKGAKGFSEG